MARDAARSFADPESVRILDLYRSSIRESAGKLGVAWLEGTPPSFDRPKLALDPKTTSRSEKPTAPSVPRPTPAASHAVGSVADTTASSPRPPAALDPQHDPARDTLIDTWNDIPVDLELAPTSSGEREAVGPRHYDEDITLDALEAPPPAEETIAPVPPPAAGSYVRLMLVAGAVGFIAITTVLFGAEHAGVPAHALVQKAWQAILALAH